MKKEKNVDLINFALGWVGRKQLKILCSPRESFLIKRHLAKKDPKSFVSVISVKSVWGRGRGFSDIRDME